MSIEDIQKILEECAKQSNLQIDDQQLFELSKALFDDASSDEKQSVIRFYDLKQQMSKYDGLLDNLCLIIDQLFLANKTPRNKKKKHIMSPSSKPYKLVLMILLIANVALMVYRAVYFLDFPSLSGLVPNPFYLVSRACGENFCDLTKEFS